MAALLWLTAVGAGGELRAGVESGEAASVESPPPLAPRGAEDELPGDAAGVAEVVAPVEPSGAFGSLAGLVAVDA